MKARTLICAGAVALALVSSACAGSDAPKQATETVVIDTFAFEPKLLHVHAGDTVEWTNKDNIVHTVTSGSREYAPGDSGHVMATHKDGMFDTPLDGKGATASFTFSTPGTFHYFCDRHPGMEADVDVG
jgi:plastocyanin